MTYDVRTLGSADAMKALAHPLRMNLLEALVLDGPGTATELAHRLDESPSNCSWHLRKLAEFGFVEEAPGAAGRNRPWRAASQGLSWSGDDEETRQAGHGLTDLLLERELQRLRAARAREASEPEEWREAGSITQSALWLTAAEAREISQQIEELLLSKMDRLADPALRPEGSRLVSAVAWLVPREGEDR